MKKNYKNYIKIICFLFFSVLSAQIKGQHFNFEGGNAVDPVWIIFFQEVTLGGVDLEAGDEIAIFDGGKMVGAFILTQVCTPANFFENDLAAFSTLNSGPGYTPGNPVSFKCWDASLEIESESFGITFQNPYGDAWTQSLFPPGDGEYSIVNLNFNWIYVGNITGTITNAETSQPIEGCVVTLEGTSHTATSVLDGTYLIEDIEIGNYSLTASAAGYHPETIFDVEVISCETTILNFNLLTLLPSQYYNLNEGYQLISSRLISGNPDMQNIFQNNLDNLEFVRNTAGFMLQKIGPVWVNNIGNWVNTEGYLIKMSSADELAITGTAIDPQTPIALTTGYQIIGYLPGQAMNTEDVFQDVLGSLEFVRNTAGFMFQKIGPVWVNNIGDMQAGEGYLIYMNSDNVLIYPGSASFSCGEVLTDARNQQTYNTVLIGEQCWMAENLNIGTMINGTEEMTDNSEIEKYCYENNTVNCDDFGGLYQWNEIMQYVSDTAVQGICPDNWHIPTDYELKILEATVDSQYPVSDPVWNNTGDRGFDAGLNLKSTTGWNYAGNGTDLFGFTALASGFRSYVGIFNYLGDCAHIWSSTEDGNNLVWNRKLFYGFDNIGRYNSGMGFGFSVRCLLDEINRAPETPSSPNPEDNSIDQSVETDLSWTCTDPDNDPLTYDIYFGTGTTPPLVATAQSGTTYDPGTLEYNTEYFWKIVAHDYYNNITQGPIWSFTTEEQQFTCGIPFTDSRDGQTYNTVQIGTQCWMAENLNIGTMINGSEEMTDNSVIEKYCYDNNTANCDEYGGLYQWNEMMQYTTIAGVRGICPSGWYLPTDEEWTTLTDFLGGESVAGGKMKEAGTVHWSSPNAGATNESGFTCLPGGNRNPDHSFSYLTLYTNFWLSSEYSGSNAWIRGLHYNSSIVSPYNYTKFSGFSVRCLKDPANQPPEIPSTPNPEDEAVNQSTDIDLSWTCIDPEGDPLTYDIYFGANATPPQIATGQTGTTYDPGTLQGNTEYFWKIIAHDNQSNTTEGPVWSFTTETWVCDNPFTDSRDGQIYNTIIIGTQCWMAENLNSGTMITGTTGMSDNAVIEKYCYENNSANCDEYGGLYQWNEIMQYTSTEGVQGICPTGWYIPTDDEWKILEGNVDSQYPVGDPVWDNTDWRGLDAGLNLKSTTGWNGTDLYGFSALPGGFRGYDGNFSNMSSFALFWSSTEDINNLAWDRRLHNTYGGVARYNSGEGFGFSVRCLLNETNQAPETPSSPNPEDNSIDQSIETDLSWTCTDPDNDPITYDIYFGTEATPPQLATAQTGTTYDPGNLENDTEYFWKIVAHDDHSNTTEGPVWSFITIVNSPPESPSTPSPEDNAEDQSIEIDISWTCTDPEGDPLTYDVYFGTQSTPPQVTTGQTGATFDPGNLENYTEYFWKIIAHDDHSNTTEGPVWSFFTIANSPPESPSTPNPVDNAENQSIEVDLSWTCNDPDGDPLTYDIYFGTEATPPQVVQDQTQTTYDPGTLEYNTEYFWKIVAHDDNTPVYSTEGPIWSFTTEIWVCDNPFIDSRNGQTYNSIQIGEQCWMAENLNIGIRIDSAITMSDNSVIEKYCYGDNTTNCNNYGGLYQWNEMMEYTSTQGVQGICPLGWHIPADDEWKILEGTVDSQYPVGHPIWNSTGWRGYNAGLNLKTTNGWNGNNYYGFSALPGGYRDPGGSFNGFSEYAYFYSSLPSGSGAWSRALASGYSTVFRNIVNQDAGCSIRCLKDVQFQCGDPLTDARDQQTYETVQIDSQCWMAENLNIGNQINCAQNMTNNSVIEKYCYGNSSGNCNEYGGLYQWDEMMQYTTTPGVQGICPAGWHLPTDGELTTLTDFLGGESVAGGKMKETGTVHWQSPNTGATNESGFTALPGGLRHTIGSCNDLTSYAYFWSSSESNSNYVWYRSLLYFEADVYRFYYDKIRGFSVRCVQD